MGEIRTRQMPKVKVVQRCYQQKHLDHVDHGFPRTTIQSKNQKEFPYMQIPHSHKQKRGKKRREESTGSTELCVHIKEQYIVTTWTTCKRAYTSGMLSISPSGRRTTPWYLSVPNLYKSLAKKRIFWFSY